VPIVWNSPPAQAMSPRTFVCGYCGDKVGPNQGFTGVETFVQQGTIAMQPQQPNFVYICSSCNRPTYFDATGKQTPGAPHGDIVNHLEPNLEKLYNEARDCMRVSAYTPAVLACRKILMHVAVDQKAKENQSFVDYVEYLDKNGIIPKGARPWVDHIRTKGNEANHEIVVMTKVEAERLVEFTEMLLKMVYEFPAQAPPPPTP